MSDVTDKIRRAQVKAGEDAVIGALPEVLGISREEFERRMNAPYTWPTRNGVRLPQGDCYECRKTDKRHPEGTACDYSCVGI